MRPIPLLLFPLVLFVGCADQPTSTTPEAQAPTTATALSPPPAPAVTTAPEVQPEPASTAELVLEVTASAYNSLAAQTNANPTLTAWGDTLKPGMRAIAVSRDLIAMGLTHNAKVRIDGLEGEYRVLDKMNKRWTKKIDIYMGTDVNAARAWGRRTVTIRWTPATE